MPSVATIGPTAIAVPDHPIIQEDVKQVLRGTLAMRPERLEAVLSLFDGAGVSRRFSVMPLEDLQRPRRLTETMAVYREQAVRLGRQVASECLARAEMAPTEVDLVITVSCTGFMIPSLDAHLVNDLGLRSDVRRLPITQLGCLAGAAALSHAADFVAGHPGANVLLVSVELPTLSFQGQDHSAANLVSTALFGDGAAAALITGRERRGAQILATESHLFPNSLDALGFDLKDDGFHVVLARELPAMVRAGVGSVVERLLARAGVAREDLRTFLLHPGGKRILEALEQELGLDRDDTGTSWSVLRHYGNLSSAAVLFVLHEQLARARPDNGTHGLLGAFGPGFSSELLLLRWN